MSGSVNPEDISLLTDPIMTPCIGVCTLGPRDLCMGCFRTTQEICKWLNFSDRERRTIMAGLPSRLESLFNLP